jgi:sulfur carrier protein ThiS
MLQVTINGQPRQFPEGLTINQALRQLAGSLSSAVFTCAVIVASSMVSPTDLPQPVRRMLRDPTQSASAQIERRRLLARMIDMFPIMQRPPAGHRSMPHANEMC